MTIEQPKNPFARLGVTAETVAEIPANNLLGFVTAAYKAAAAASHPDRGGNEQLFKQVGRAYEELAGKTPKQLSRIAKEYLTELSGPEATRLVASDLSRETEAMKARIRDLRNHTLAVLVSSGEELTRSQSPFRLRVTDLVTQGSVKNKEGLYHAKHTYYLEWSKSGKFSVRRSTEPTAVALPNHRVVLLGSVAASRERLEDIVKKTPPATGAPIIQLQSNRNADTLPALFHPLSTANLFSNLYGAFTPKVTEGNFLVVALIDRGNLQAQPSLFVLGDLSRAQTELEQTKIESITYL